MIPSRSVDRMSCLFMPEDPLDGYYDEELELRRNLLGGDDSRASATVKVGQASAEIYRPQRGRPAVAFARGFATCTGLAVMGRSRESGEVGYLVGHYQFDRLERLTTQLKTFAAEFGQITGVELIGTRTSSNLARGALVDSGIISKWRDESIETLHFRTGSEPWGFALALHSRPRNNRLAVVTRGDIHPDVPPTSQHPEAARYKPHWWAVEQFDAPAALRHNFLRQPQKVRVPSMQASLR